MNLARDYIVRPACIMAAGFFGSLKSFRTYRVRNSKLEASESCNRPPQGNLLPNVNSGSTGAPTPSTCPRAPVVPYLASGVGVSSRRSSKGGKTTSVLNLNVTPCFPHSPALDLQLCAAASAASHGCAVWPWCLRSRI
jgi:hypothetical protein